MLKLILYKNHKKGVTNNMAFTLVEVMISITIFFLILGGVFAVYEQSIRLFRQNDIRTEVVDNLRVALNRISRELMTCEDRLSVQDHELSFITRITVNQKDTSGNYLKDNNGNYILADQYIKIRYYLKPADVKEIQTNNPTNELVREVTELQRQDNGDYLPNGITVANPIALYIKNTNFAYTNPVPIYYSHAPGGEWYPQGVKITLTGGVQGNSNAFSNDIVLSTEVSIPAFRDVRY